MARAPVKDIPLSSELRPVASPTDTFVRPGPSPLRGLADALGTVDKSLQTFIQSRDAKQQQDDELRGKAAFYADHEGELARAVTEGKIPAQYSPSYVRGFKNAQGSAAGDQLRDAWQTAWDQWDGKNSEDPQAFDTFFQDFLKNKIGTQDPDVLRGYLPAIEALQANARTQYIQYRHDATVTGEANASAATILSGVQRSLDDGLVSEKGTDYGAVFKGINDGIAASLALGDPGGKKVETFIDAMSAKVLETRDPKLLEWFNQKVPGQDYTYAETPYGLKVKNATLESLETKAHQQEARLTAQQKAEQERLKDEAQTKIIDGIISNPNAPIDDALLAQAEKNGDPTIKVQAAQWRDTLLKAKPSDPRALQHFYSQVVAGEVSPQAALRQALSSGLFQNADDLKAAVTFTQSFHDKQDTIEKTLSGSTSRNILEAIRTRTIAKDDTYNPIAGTSDEGFEASSDFRELITRWVINNPNATPQELDEQVNKVGKQILERITVPPGGDAMTSAQTYQRDPNLPFDNAFTSGSSVPQPGTQDGASGSDVRQWEMDNQVTPEQKAKIAAQAERNGMSYEEYVRAKGMGGGKQQQQQPSPQTPKAPDGTAVDPINYTPSTPTANEAPSGSQVGGDETVQLTPEQAESFIDKVFNEATATGATAGGLQAGASEKSLLDLIAIPESRGNYNAVFGNVNSTRDLSKYSVDDILAAQQEARQRGAKSTAIGRYQFIYKTLGSLKAEMGLTGREAFTPELQDRMGVALLNRRGLQAFKEGRISKKTFALSLSQEWAGLPNPETGRSYYAGDGLNKSGISTGKVYAALGFGGLGGGGEAPVPSPPSGPLAYDPYANIPDTDGTGAAGQKAKFLQWNPDPLGNHEANLKQLQPSLGNVIRRAQELSGVRFAIGSGKRDAASQQKAVEWGWSKTLDSDHLDGGAVDLWPVDEKGAINFDPQNQTEIVKAMKKAAKELGVELDIGADWKRFTDKPHFALKKNKSPKATPDKEV